MRICMVREAALLRNKQMNVSQSARTSQRTGFRTALRTVGLLCVATTLALASSVAVGRTAPGSNEPVQAWVTDGSVYAVAATPGGVYIGGSFTLLGRPTGSWVALNAGAGILRRPLRIGEPVVAAVSDGRRGWFLATTGEGETDLLHVRGDATVDPKWHPRTDGRVVALARSGQRVFLAGDFAKVGDRPHARLAAVDTRTGRALAWRPDVAAKKPKDFANVEVLEMSSDQRTLYFSGEFARVGGKAREGLAAVDVKSAKATKWRPSADGEVYDLAMARNGRAVYVGGDFSRLDGRNRRHLGAVDARTGAATDWNPQSNGAVDVITVARSRVY